MTNCSIKLIFTVLMIVVSNSKSLNGIKYCQIGLGHSGKRSLQLALHKGATLTAAFTRTNFIGMDVSEVLGLSQKLGIIVSPITDLNEVLQDAKPDICQDATKDNLQSVYNHFKILLSNGVNIITLASHLIYPYLPDDIKMATDLDEIAKTNNVTLSVTGIQDTYYQMNVLSMISSMNHISTLDLSWVPKSDEVEYWTHKGSQETKDILEPFTIQMIKWYAAQLEWHELYLDCSHEYRETLDPYNNIQDGNIIGIWNLTCVFDAYSNFDKRKRGHIIWRNEFYAGNDDTKNVMVVKLIGDPDQELTVKDIPVGVSSNIVMNRIHQVIDGEPGFYSIHKLGMGKLMGNTDANIQQNDKQDL